MIHHHQHKPCWIAKPTKVVHKSEIKFSDSAEVGTSVEEENLSFNHTGISCGKKSFKFSGGNCASQYADLSITNKL